MLTDDESEARILVDVIRDHQLYTSVVTLGAHLVAAAELLARAPSGLQVRPRRTPSGLQVQPRRVPPGLQVRPRRAPPGLQVPPRRALLLCSRSADRAKLERLHFKALAPTPCDTTAAICAFDPYRISKVVNERELYSPSVISILGRIQLTEIELRDLIRQYRISGPKAAVTELLARHEAWTGPPREARTAVMVPAGTRREAFDASALRAAAVLAEEDSAHSDTISFKVELLDDQCKSTLAFKYLTDALGAEFGALSGVAGPACGAAFADVARQSPTLAMPVLGYTPQAPPPPPAAAFAVLAAGDARLYTKAWAAFAAHMGWQRVAVLSELATRAALDVAELVADVIVHVELPADSEEVALDKVLQVRHSYLHLNLLINHKG